MRTEKVNFYSEGIKLAGVLYLPDDEKAKPYPGIVQGPGFLGLKDAKHYIMMFEKLSAAGYACLCFDYRGWGDSEGDQRGWVLAGRRYSDRAQLPGNPFRHRCRPAGNLRLGRHRRRQCGLRSGHRLASEMLRQLSRRQQRARVAALDAPGIRVGRLSQKHRRRPQAASAHR